MLIDWLFYQFFYPAADFIYKNHQVILDSCYELKKQGIHDYRVIFTFLGDENPCAAALYAFVEKHDLPVEFHGPFPRAEVFELYAKTVLLFPSYIETFGMPLLEARISGAPILAADTPFAREILEEYVRARFFPYDSSQELSDSMKDIMR